MKVPHSPRTTGLRFNMMPLIDVIFLLIIFFLVASHFVTQEQAEAVELPKAIRVDDTPHEPSPFQISITLTKEGRYHSAGKERTLDWIEARIQTTRTSAEEAGQVKNFEVILRGDQKAHFKSAKEILKVCAKSRVPVVSIAVLPKSK